MQAQVQMEFAFNALACADGQVTLATAYAFLTSDTEQGRVIGKLAAVGTPEAEALTDHYHDNFNKQPPEQLGGVKTTIANYLKCFTEPGIAEVFCPPRSTFNFDDIDRGKIICVSIP